MEYQTPKFYSKRNSKSRVGSQEAHRNKKKYCLEFHSSFASHFPARDAIFILGVSHLTALRLSRADIALLSRPGVALGIVSWVHMTEEPKVQRNRLLPTSGLHTSAKKILHAHHSIPNSTNSNQ